MSGKGRRIAVAALLLLAGSSGAWLLRGRTPSPQGAGAASAGVRTSEERVAMLEQSLELIEAGLQDAPRDRWDPEYVVDVLGRDPQRLFDWVRASTDWVPYRGVLRGPAGVLMDRLGSSLDRALLLATLLEKAGHTVRLAHGELTRDQAVELLPDLVARQSAFAAGTFDTTSVPQVDAGAAAYGLDAGAIEYTEASLTDGVGRLFSELHARAADQTERLLREVRRPKPDTDWARRHRVAVGALRDHWWVQRSDGSAWRDLDLLAPDSLARSALTTPLTTADLSDLPPGQHHELVVRVVAERWAAGTLSEQRVMEHVLRPFESLGQPMVLQIWPEAMPQQLQADPNSPHGLRAAALEQDSWNAALAIGPAVVAQGTIALTSKPPAGGGPMGGLGAGILGAAREMRGESAGEATDELSAVWIEYEVRAPGEEPHIDRRAVFDLLGPTARATHATATLVMDEQKRLTRGLALMLRSEMLPVTSAVAPEYLAHLTGRNMVANRTALRAIAAGVPALSSMEPDSMLGEGAPPLSPLWSLALARLEWSRHGDVQYVDRIGLLTRHRHPGPMGDAITLRGSVDVVTGEFGVSLAAPDAFIVRHTQGVFDTNAEALWWTGEGLNNTGEAFAESRKWTTLTGPDADLERLHLPADARSRIAQDLASGLIVVAPTQPVPRGPDQFVGWWRIDPATGATEGIAGNGWGQCGAEYATVESVVIRAMWRGLWEYVLCQGINQAINDFRRTGAELQAKGIWFWWVGPIESASPEDVFWSSNKGCLIGAIQAGFVSTLPFLIARANYTGTRSWLMPKADWLDRFLRDQRGGIRIPPRLARGQLPGLVRAQARGGPIVPAAVARGGGSAPIDPLAETYPGRTPTNQAPPAAGRNPGGRAPTSAGRNPGRAPELGKTQDLGKTQPDMRTQPGMQRPDAPARPRPEGPYPKSHREAYNNWKRADDAAVPEVHKASEATGEWIRYRNTGPFPEEGILGDPDFNPDHLDMLEARMNEADMASDLAVAKVKAAERMYDWATKAANLGDIPWYPEAPAAPQSAGCLPSCAAPASGGSPGGALNAGNAGVAGTLGGFPPPAP